MYFRRRRKTRRNWEGKDGSLKGRREVITSLKALEGFNSVRLRRETFAFGGRTSWI